MNRYVIIRPVITEQSMNDAKEGKFTFVVSHTADKTAVKKVIEKQYGVNVTSVVTKTQKGRTKRVGVRRQEVTVSPVKKAIVGVQKGQKISLFDITT